MPFTLFNAGTEYRNVYKSTKFQHNHLIVLLYPFFRIEDKEEPRQSEFPLVY